MTLVEHKIRGHFAKKSPYQSADLTTAVLTTDRKHSNPPSDSTTAPFDIILPSSTIYRRTWQLSHPPVTVLSTQSWLWTLRQPMLSSSPSQLVVLFIQAEEAVLRMWSLYDQSDCRSRNSPILGLQALSAKSQDSPAHLRLCKMTCQSCSEVGLLNSVWLWILILTCNSPLALLSHRLKTLLPTQEPGKRHTHSYP